jgi:hypothetical protein
VASENRIKLRKKAGSHFVHRSQSIVEKSLLESIEQDFQTLPKENTYASIASMFEHGASYFNQRYERLNKKK